ncbi:dehydrogenase/reductase SDR family member 7-like [Iris pallida]|uniref:Dehydrogenase/reductase SDR family member 7-like n=1 Tax=Iris pallida TaxID=29817 RepID=A0AAX6HF86_IRIPA|nr:dehydrogenase/reductase SDR family member 7-like [Iris pallida]
MVLLIAIVAVLFLSLLAFAVVFALADGDFTLLTARPAKREEIEGKVVWITGASRGIGEVLAKQFAKLGARLILSARNVAELERVKAEILGKNSSCEVEVLPMDLTTSEESLRESVQKAESYFSYAGVDYMVHNAGRIPRLASALKITEESLMTTFQTNVLGPIALTRLLAPYMLKRRRGHFIVISSAVGKVHSPFQTDYCASKFALNGYFHTLRTELLHRGIKVTVVCPGQIDVFPDIGDDNPLPPVPVERCVRLIITAAIHGLKEVWIAKQPILLTMYVMQYMPSIGFWVMDKVGAATPEPSATSSQKKKAT